MQRNSLFKCSSPNPARNPYSNKTHNSSAYKLNRRYPQNDYTYFKSHCTKLVRNPQSSKNNISKQIPASSSSSKSQVIQNPNLFPPSKFSFHSKFSKNQVVCAHSSSLNARVAKIHEDLKLKKVFANVQSQKTVLSNNGNAFIKFSGGNSQKAVATVGKKYSETDKAGILVQIPSTQSDTSEKSRKLRDKIATLTQQLKQANEKYSSRKVLLNKNACFNGREVKAGMTPASSITPPTVRKLSDTRITAVKKSSISPPDFKVASAKKSAITAVQNQKLGTKVSQLSLDISKSAHDKSAARNFPILHTHVKKVSLHSAKKFSWNKKTAKVLNPQEVASSKTNLNSTPKTSSKYSKIQKSRFSSSHKRPARVTKLITTQYKVINRVSPAVPKSPNNYSVGRSLTQNKITNKVSHLSSKYKVVNKRQTPQNHRKLPLKHSPGKSISKNKLSSKKKLSQYKLVNKSNSVDLKRNLFTYKRMSISKKLMDTKPQVFLKDDSTSKIKAVTTSNVPSTPRRLHKKFIVNSKYKIVKKPGSSHKKIPKRSRLSLNKLRELYNNHTDIDLIKELSEAGNSLCKNSNFLTSPKNTLVCRVFKSKNTLINKNGSTAQVRTARSIKSKYFTLNKRSPLQRKHQTNLINFQGSSSKSHFQKSNYAKSFQYRKTRNYNAFNVGKHIHAAGRMKFFNQTVFRPRKQYVKLNYAVGHGRTKRTTVFSKSFNNASTPKTPVPVARALASRVLHRSINQALSVRKRTSKVHCMFYNRFGRCNKGDTCSFVHDPSKIAVCTRFLRGTCKEEKCPFSHERNPGKMAVCCFFLTGTCSKKDCPYRHETLPPDARMCKAFAQGHCQDGKECKNAHVLVCPQYMQGSCSKGDKCTFPHPLQKEKKKSKSAGNTEVSKDQEEFSEQANRYFLPGNEVMPPGSAESVFVPRRRNLPEQPSFISLSFTTNEV